MKTAPYCLYIHIEVFLSKIFLSKNFLSKTPVLLVYSTLKTKTLWPYSFAQVTQNDIFPPYNVRQHQPRDGARFSYHGEAPRMRTPSPPRHMTLDPRKLNRLKPSRQSPQRHFHGPPANMGPAIVSMRQGTGTYPGRVEPWGRGPQRVPPMSRMDSRPLPPEPREIPPRQDYDDDYCSETDDPVASNVAPMRREYSQWELEKQKREKKLKLIQGEI